jgi:hypothetical protein
MEPEVSSVLLLVGFRGTCYVAAPMGLFSRGKREPPDLGIEGVALIRESEPLLTGADKRG